MACFEILTEAENLNSIIPELKLDPTKENNVPIVSFILSGDAFNEVSLFNTFKFWQVKFKYFLEPKYWPFKKSAIITFIKYNSSVFSTRAKQNSQKYLIENIIKQKI